MSGAWGSGACPQAEGALGAVERGEGRGGAGGLSPHQALPGEGDRTSRRLRRGCLRGRRALGEEKEAARSLRWLEGFGLGAPKPQPAFRPEGHQASPVWLHLPSELGSALSAQGSGPSQRKPQSPSEACLLPAWPPAVV